MSAYDPKRILARPSNLPVQLDTMAFVSLRGSDEGAAPSSRCSAARRRGRSYRRALKMEEQHAIDSLPN
jgi:hypothetical protein